LTTPAQPEAAANARPGDTPPAFVWKDFSRFVEVHPVRTGWLVLWGRYEEQGARKVLAGNRTYPELAGARRRLVDTVLELTRRPPLAAEALALFDRSPVVGHVPAGLPEPL